MPASVVWERGLMFGFAYPLLKSLFDLKSVLLLLLLVRALKLWLLKSFVILKSPKLSLKASNESVSLLLEMLFVVNFVSPNGSVVLLDLRVLDFDEKVSLNASKKLEILYGLRVFALRSSLLLSNFGTESNVAGNKKKKQ